MGKMAASLRQRRRTVIDLQDTFDHFPGTPPGFV